MHLVRLLLAAQLLASATSLSPTLDYRGAALAAPDRLEPNSIPKEPLYFPETGHYVSGRSRNTGKNMAARPPSGPP